MRKNGLENLILMGNIERKMVQAKLVGHLIDELEWIVEQGTNVDEDYRG